MGFVVKKFNELSVSQLYRILQLRYNIFVAEQGSIYNEFDDVDYNAVHIFSGNNRIFAYLRVFKKSSKIAGLGRVAVDREYRKKGVGSRLVQAGVDYVKSHWKCEKICIEAQEYLKKFYESFGFKQVSGVYLDCGVPHIDMELVL